MSNHLVSLRVPSKRTPQSDKLGILTKKEGRYKGDGQADRRAVVTLLLRIYFVDSMKYLLSVWFVRFALFFLECRQGGVV